MPRKKNFIKFRKLIKKTKKVDKVTISALNSEYDFFITGSDQVWNYNLTNFDTCYFLDFVNDSKKKLSYAASLGFDSFSEKIAKEYNLLLNDFSALNVREKSASVLLERVLNKKVVVGLDPTLLLEKDDWDKIAIEPKVKDYIFVYQLSPSRYMTDIIKKLKQKTGLKVVAVPFVMGTVNAYCDMTAGPSEWIGYIKKC